MAELWCKGSVSVIVQPKQEGTLFSWFQSPGNCGATGRTVENNPADERRQRVLGGRVIDTEGKQEWADGHSLDRERSGVSLLIYIFSLLPPRLDGSKGMLSTRSVRNRPVFTTETRVSRLKCDSFSSTNSNTTGKPWGGRRVEKFLIYVQCYRVSITITILLHCVFC